MPYFTKFTHLQCLILHMKEPHPNPSIFSADSFLFLSRVIGVIESSEMNE